MFPRSFPSFSVMVVLPVVVILVCLQEVSSVLSTLSWPICQSRAFWDSVPSSFRGGIYLGCCGWVCFCIELCSAYCQCTEMHLISVYWSYIQRPFMFLDLLSGKSVCEKWAVSSFLVFSPYFLFSLTVLGVGMMMKSDPGYPHLTPILNGILQT